MIVLGIVVFLSGSRSAAVASVLSVLDIILTSSPVGYSLLYSGQYCSDPTIIALNNHCGYCLIHNACPSFCILREINN